MILRVSASQDIVYVGGRGDKELHFAFWVYDVHAPYYVGLSDGTLVTCNRKKGVWRFKTQTTGTTGVRHVPASEEHDSPSDLLELDGQFMWAVGSAVRVERKGAASD
ncbi:hypothetical protein LCGC14_0712920 [marine sediment metagenome]|uniref:Uncharacterized protein n=1 Tax=marine sediment metagenome TaxID=412755 RepID=A0A0F9QZZ6_9ZZZZ